MIISNYSALAVTPLRKQALLIADAGLEATAASRLVEEHFRYDPRSKVLTVRGQSFATADYDRVTVVGFGKAALSAVTGIQETLGDRVSRGFIIDIQRGAPETMGGNIVYRAGTHPQPTVANVAATKELVAMLGQSTASDLVLCVASGGGNSLLCDPSDMTCDQERGIIDALTESGASVLELNTVRKHISKVKGGNLAKICYPATVISLIFSDAPGNALDLVAGGPTVKDLTTVHDAAAILQKYNVLERCKLPSCELVETPKEDKYFANIHNILFASADDALRAMKKKADDLGFEVKIGDQASPSEALDRSGLCLIGVEENSWEMVLAALPKISNDRILVAIDSAGHGSGAASGAIADSRVAEQAVRLGLAVENFLSQPGSPNFFEQAGGLLQIEDSAAGMANFFVALRL